MAGHVQESPPLGKRGFSCALEGTLKRQRIEGQNASPKVLDDDDDAVSNASVALALAGKRRGRPQQHGPNSCLLCRYGSDSADPVFPSSDLKWAYPPKNGKPQGGFCWYCAQTGACFPEYIGKALHVIKDLGHAQVESEKVKFFQRRNTIIDLTIRSGGKFDKRMLPPESVTRIESSSMHHKRHGLCMSAR